MVAVTLPAPTAPVPASVLPDRGGPTATGLPAAPQAATVALLNRALADALDLHSQLKHARWNVRGHEFLRLHLLFDGVAERLAAAADLIAERAVALGGFATGTARMTVAATRLPDLPADLADGMGFVDALVDRFALATASTRAGIGAADALGDADTADVLAEVSRRLDEDRVFLQTCRRP